MKKISEKLLRNINNFPITSYGILTLIILGLCSICAYEKNENFFYQFLNDFFDIIFFPINNLTYAVALFIEAVIDSYYYSQFLDKVLGYVLTLTPLFLLDLFILNLRTNIIPKLRKKFSKKTELK